MEYKDIPANKLDKTIYKYIDFYRVIQMFKNNEMVFVQPKVWEDPFENYTLNTEIALPNGYKTMSQFNDSIYCQCWTSSSVSDAMWRIYSPHRMSVRIRTTYRLLAEAIDNSKKRKKTIESYIGKVRYLSQKALLEKAKSLSNHLTTYMAKEAAIESLMLKRKSFYHEKEIRALIVNSNNSNNELLKIKINPHYLIKGILIDSRAPKEIVDLYKTYLKKELGFKGLIGQSSLYDKKEPIKIKI